MRRRVGLGSLDEVQVGYGSLDPPQTLEGRLLDVLYLDHSFAMKSINETITVDASNGVPRRIRWGRHIYHTRKLLDYWIVQTRWWGREERRIYFRLETDRTVMEVYHASGFCSDTCSTFEADARPHPTIEGPGAAPPFIEGDTHTRELRHTDFPYRPDGRYRRRTTSSRTKPLHWMLSKILD